MLKEGNLVGTIALYRTEVRPFTDKQIELVQNFAAQAVIAIENTRLLNELRESLQQQSATADVLRVISSSPGELAPVFDAMLANATRICGAEFGIFYLDDGDLTRIAAVYNVPPALAATQDVPLRVHPKAATPRFAGPSKSCRSTTSERCRHISKEIRGWPLSPTLAALARLSACRCSRKMCCSA
jgi:hypothetical protein